MVNDLYHFSYFSPFSLLGTTIPASFNIFQQIMRFSWLIWTKIKLVILYFLFAGEVARESECVVTGEETIADIADKAYEDYACEKCGQADHPEWILLCDKCDHGYHASCLRPPIMLIPEGDWFCPPCQHVKFSILLKPNV